MSDSNLVFDKKFPAKFMIFFYKGGVPMLLILIAYQKGPFDSTYQMQFFAL